MSSFWPTFSIAFMSANRFCCADFGLTLMALVVVLAHGREIACGASNQCPLKAQGGTVEPSPGILAIGRGSRGAVAG
jgi:hypothetical protein